MFDITLAYALTRLAPLTRLASLTALAGTALASLALAPLACLAAVGFTAIPAAFCFQPIDGRPDVLDVRGQYFSRIRSLFHVASVLKHRTPLHSCGDGHQVGLQGGHICSLNFASLIHGHLLQLSSLQSVWQSQFVTLISWHF